MLQYTLYIYISVSLSLYIYIYHEGGGAEKAPHPASAGVWCSVN